MTATPDAITQAAEEAEKTLPPPLPPLSGGMEIHGFALLDQNGAIIARQPLPRTVVTSGGDITFSDITFSAM